MNVENKLKKAIKLYNSVGIKQRNMEFLAHWLFNIYYKFGFLPIIKNKYRKILALDKTRLAIFAILIDDLADNKMLRNGDKLIKSIKLIYSGKEKQKDKYIEATIKIFKETERSIRKYPKYEKYRHMFFFDMHNFISSILYGYIANNYEAFNEIEEKIFPQYNIMVMPYLTMDLMCSKKNIEDLAEFRKLCFKIQHICHLGNVINTFEREIMEEDFSCPLIVEAIAKGILTKEQIKKDKEKSIAILRKTLVNKYINAAYREIRNLGLNTLENLIDAKKLKENLRNVIKAYIKRPKYWKDKQNY